MMQTSGERFGTMVALYVVCAHSRSSHVAPAGSDRTPDPTAPLMRLKEADAIDDFPAPSLSLSPSAAAVADDAHSPSERWRRPDGGSSRRWR